MRVTSKGQVTVPKKLRDQFGITRETELEFRVERHRLVLVKTGAEAAVERLRGRVKKLPMGGDVDGYVRTTRGS